MHHQKKIIGVRSLIFVLILLSFAVTTLQANVNTNGCADTNASYTLDELVGGGSIVIDDKLFDGWVINDFSTSATNLGHIDVLALANDPLVNSVLSVLML